MSELGAIIVNSETLVLHMQGEEPDITARGLRELCVKSDPKRLYRRWYQFEAVNWPRALSRNTTCHKVYSSVFDKMVNNLYKDNNWQKYPYAVIVHDSDQDEVSSQVFSRLA